jgi:hypothetical protein
MKIAVVKANFGGRNSIFWDNVPQIEGVSYNYFTTEEADTTNLPDNVNIISVKENNCILDRPTGMDRYRSRRQAKLYKILPDLFLPDYDYYIWMDAYFELYSDPRYVIDSSGITEDGKNFAFFKHSQRDCLYEEGELIREINYDCRQIVESQLRSYKSCFEYPENNGLYECTCFIFKNTQKSKHVRLEWMNHINYYSSRDQLSLPFVLNQMEETPVIIPGGILPGYPGQNPYFVSGGNR